MPQQEELAISICASWKVLQEAKAMQSSGIRVCGNNVVQSDNEIRNERWYLTYEPFVWPRRYCSCCWLGWYCMRTDPFTVSWKPYNMVLFLQHIYSNKRNASKWNEMAVIALHSPQNKSSTGARSRTSPGRRIALSSPDLKGHLAEAKSVSPTCLVKPPIPLWRTMNNRGAFDAVWKQDKGSAACFS